MTPFSERAASPILPNDSVERQCRPVTSVGRDEISLLTQQASTAEEAGDLLTAAECYQRLIELAPQTAVFHFQLGNILLIQGQVGAAIDCFQRGLELEPDNTGACNNLAVALNALGRFDEAAQYLRRALTLVQDVPEIINNLGVSLKALGKLDQAAECFERALTLKPDQSQWHNNLGSTRKDQGRLNEAIACFRRAVDLDPTDAISHSNLVYTQLYSPDFDGPALRRELAEWNKRHAAPLTGVAEQMGLPPFQGDPNQRAQSCSPMGGRGAPALRKPPNVSREIAHGKSDSIEPAVAGGLTHLLKTDRRLRIGYVSPDFRDHVAGRYLVPLFRMHDHEQFDIHAYSNVTCPDHLTQFFHNSCDTWHETAGLTDEQLAQRIHEDQIDILVDLSVHMAQNRLKVFGMKPAPIQVTCTGYPGSTGLTNMDYRLTDPYLDPPGINDHHYCETSLRLANSFWCYDPVGSKVNVSPLPLTSNGFVTFGCLNNFCKINPPLLQLWGQILKAVTNSRLRLLAGEGRHRQTVIELLAESGIAPDRIMFLPVTTRDDYLKYYHDVDIALDSVPYNGHTTTLDALWMSVPVVTLVGQTVVGRAGLSQLTNIGLSDLITLTPQQYIDTAIDLSRDVDRLNQLRSTLRQRMQSSPLMDAKGFAYSIEESYRKMWRRWCFATHGVVGCRDEVG